MVEGVAIIVAGLVLGVWAFHRIGAILDARLARKELEARIAQLDQAIDDVSATRHLRLRRIMDRERPIGRLLAAVRDEPTVPLR